MTEAAQVVEVRDTERSPDRIDRGLALWRARRRDIRLLSDGRWRVPSSRSRGEYLVDLAARTCTCADYRFNLALAVGGGELCKHGWAAIFEAHFRAGASR